MWKRFGVIVLGVVLFISCTTEKKGKRTLFVSILPQKYFVERIAGDDFEVQTLVLPGHSPATYEPLPQQMSKLSSAEMFFRIGVPFENSWLRKIESSNPNLKIIDTRKNIELRAIENAKELFENQKHYSDVEERHQEADPHIWLSPKLVKIQAQNIYEAVSELNPKHRELYKANLQEFLQDLTDLQKEFQHAFSQIEQNKFLVFHPVWGYLADEFGLQQIPIELSGKMPSAKELSTIIEFARKEKIHIIFVQKQFSTQEAKAIAQAIQGKIIQIDPLAENYLGNMRVILSVFKEQLK